MELTKKDIETIASRESLGLFAVIGGLQIGTSAGIIISLLSLIWTDNLDFVGRFVLTLVILWVLLFIVRKIAKWATFEVVKDQYEMLKKQKEPKGNIQDEIVRYINNMK